MYVGLRCAPRGRAPVSRPAPQPCASLPPLGGRLRPPHPLSAALGRHPRRPFSAPRSPRPPLGRPVRPLFGGGPCRCGGRPCGCAGRGRRGSAAAPAAGRRGRPPTDPSVAGCLVAVLLCARAGFGLLSVSFRLMGWPAVLMAGGSDVLNIKLKIYKISTCRKMFVSLQPIV